MAYAMHLDSFQSPPLFSMMVKTPLIDMARQSDASIVSTLQRIESNALGFIPYSRLREECGRGNVWIAWMGDLAVGYIMMGRLRRCIIQLMVRRPYRRRGIGTALVHAARADSPLGQRLTLRCRSDLAPAQAFWGSLLYKECGRVQGGRGRGKEIVRWESRPLTQSEQTRL